MSKEMEIGTVAGGEVIELKKVGDEVFSSGLLGDGVGIKPTQGSIFSPVDGQIITAHEAGHAYTVMSRDGAELLIHIGIDTVELSGKHFYPKVGIGDRVKRGQLIARVELEEIEKKGYDTVISLIVSNGEEIEITSTRLGKCLANDTIMTYKKI
ncbi:MAG: PTS glucose transporter subunit IIA [Clostridia bacterium]|nr:PTS glucose transporter subunit IIA [Clostridia bacterium]